MKHTKRMRELKRMEGRAKHTERDESLVQRKEAENTERNTSDAHTTRATAHLKKTAAQKEKNHNNENGHSHSASSLNRRQGNSLNIAPETYRTNSGLWMVGSSHGVS